MLKPVIIVCLTFIFLVNASSVAFSAKPDPDDPRNTLIGKVMQRKLEPVEKMIKKGADVNMFDKNSGVTPLVMACTHGLVDIAKLLVKKGADVNLPSKNGTTPLIAAAGRSQELVEFLLEKGADPAARTQEGEGAFTYSILGAMSGRVTTKVPALLLKKGAEVDETPAYGPTAGYTPLMMVASRGKLELVEFLVSHGADVNAMTADETTALSLAKEKKHKAVVKYLKKHGAKKIKKRKKAPPSRDSDVVIE